MGQGFGAESRRQTNSRKTFLKSQEFQKFRDRGHFLAKKDFSLPEKLLAFLNEQNPQKSNSSPSPRAVLLAAGDDLLHVPALPADHLLQPAGHPQTEGAPQEDPLLPHRLLQHRGHRLLHPWAPAHRQVRQDLKVSGWRVRQRVF